MIHIRVAQPEDFEFLPDIEMDAGYELALYDLQVVADMPASPPRYYETLPAGSEIFVACDETLPIGFAVCHPLDGQGHLKEVSVRREHMKKGIGKQLVQQAINWATRHDYQWLTLTTYRTIIFNAPFYKSFGFTAFKPDEKWPDLLKIRKKEYENGLEAKPRICMKLSLSSKS